MGLAVGAVNVGIAWAISKDGGKGRKPPFGFPVFPPVRHFHFVPESVFGDVRSVLVSRSGGGFRDGGHQSAFGLLHFDGDFRIGLRPGEAWKRPESAIPR